MKATIFSWIRLIAALALISILVYVVIPWLNQETPVREVTSVATARGVDATGLFYTETDQVAEAQNYLRNRAVESQD